MQLKRSSHFRLAASSWIEHEVREIKSCKMEMKMETQPWRRFNVNDAFENVDKTKQSTKQFDMWNEGN